VIKDPDPERIQKLVGCIRESVRILNEIKCMEESESIGSSLLGCGHCGSMENYSNET
jgi:hypothetical protein